MSNFAAHAVPSSLKFKSVKFFHYSSENVTIEVELNREVKIHFKLTPLTSTIATLLLLNHNGIQLIPIMCQIIAVSDNVDGSPNAYTIVYSELMSGRLCGFFTIRNSSCVDERCVHKFNILSSPCLISNDISVTVFYTNMFSEGLSSESVVFSLISYVPNKHSKCIIIIMQYTTTVIINNCFVHL